MKRIVLHIDRLVLRGFDHGDRDRLAEGLRLELAGLLANTGATQQLAGMHSVARWSVGPVHIGYSATPTQVGKLIAGGIVKGGRT